MTKQERKILDKVFNKLIALEKSIKPFVCVPELDGLSYSIDCIALLTNGMPVSAEEAINGYSKITTN